MSRQMHKPPSSNHLVAKGTTGLSSSPSNKNHVIGQPPFRSTLLQNAPSVPSHRSSTRLYTFLQCDVEPKEGHRLLPPFFTTNDLLHLSECSKGLLPYHHLLTHVKLKKPEGNLMCDEEDVMRLLSHQRSGLLSRLHLDVSLVHIFDRHQAWGRFRSLNALALEELPPFFKVEEDKPAMDGLHGELSLVGISADNSTLSHMLTTLGEGACPNLRRLELTRQSSLETRRGIPPVVVATAFGSGHLKRLQALNLTKVLWRQGDLTALSHQLQAGCCPDLRELTLSSCFNSRQDIQAFGQALRSGACLTLEKLELECMITVGSSLSPIFEALEAGSCPDLTHLSLKGARLTDAGGASLARALLSPGLCQLQHLDLRFAFKEHIDILPILNSLKQRVHPDLRYLNLGLNHLDAEKGRALGEALGNGTLPNLEELLLGNNEELGDEGVVAIMRGLEVGKCPGLTELDLNSVGMRQQGAAAISQAMMAGSMRNLKRLVLRCNPSIGHAGMAKVLDAFDAGICPKFKEIMLRDMPVI